MRIVIIGNGVAGIEAAITVRNREPSWQITVVSEESDHFFARTAMMWVVSGQLSHRCIEPYERDLYARMGFGRVRARVSGVDLEARQLHLSGSGDATLGYDRLLIASGSRPRRGPWPGSTLPGVGHFVTMQDLEWLEAELHGGPGPTGRPPRPDEHVADSDSRSPYRPRAHRYADRGAPPRHPVVVGGGLIGIEAVEVMVAAGLRPRFFIREPWFWPFALEEREAAWVVDRMRSHGVDVHLDESLVSLEGEHGLEEVTTTLGRYPSDLCVVAIGVVANTDWLEGSGLVRCPAGGILVDSSLATSEEGVFAAGDCASVPWSDGSRRPEQLWYTARDQGRVAGRCLVGDTAVYERGLPYNSAKLMDIEYTTVGAVGGAMDDARTCFFEEKGAVQSTTRIVVRDEAVVGFNLLGRRWDHSILGRWIRERRSLSYVLEHLSEASFDTEFVPPLRLPTPTPALEKARGFQPAKEGVV